MIEVMPAPRERRDQIWELFLEYAEDLTQYDGEKRSHISRHYPCFDLYWEDPNRTAFLILYDHEPIGFCLFQDTGLCYRIDEFYVRPLHRRRGFGRAVVENIKDYCRKVGRHKTLLANVYVNNAPALAFWKRAGFKDTGRRLRVRNLRLVETECELVEEQ